MDWFKIVLVVAIILQEIQIISLRRELDEVSEFFFSIVTGKVKEITAYVVNNEEDEDGKNQSDE